MKGRLIQILPGLHCWKSGLRGAQHPVNSYVLARDSQVMLIDPAEDLTPGLLQGAGLAPVRDIWITHVQEEHVAGCPHFPRARIHVPKGDEYLCQGLRPYLDRIQPWPPPWKWDTRGNFQGHLAGSCNERPSRRRLRLAGSLKAGGTTRTFRILSTPGHGKHAVSLVAEIHGLRVIFCGDVIHGQGGLWNWFDAEWDYGMQGGQKALLASVRILEEEKAHLLCPAHGAVIRHPNPALRRLKRILSRVLASVPGSKHPLNFPDRASPAPGFRRILPHLHQWREGNCAVLLSQTGNALMVDDGLCHWKPAPGRMRHHQTVLANLKQSLGIHRIEMVIPTHYHGDHTENIPDLVKLEKARVLCLDATARPIEHPEHFNLACALPWYGTSHHRIHVDRKVRSGTRLRWHEYTLELFHLGGQTSHHLGIEVMVDGIRTLFVGDAMDHRSSLCDPVLCYNQAEPVSEGWLAAIRRMLARKPGLLICGHGSAILWPMALLRKKQKAWLPRIMDFKALSHPRNLRSFFDPFYQACADFRRWPRPTHTPNAPTP